MGLRFLGSLLLAAVCFGQQYEIGALVGYGFYHGATVSGSATSAQAGIRNRIAAGFIAGEDLYEHLSGEVRYLYNPGRPYLSSGNVQTEIDGESHAFHYNALVHLNPRESSFRPYLVGGFGGKYYVTSGPAPRQALPGTATLVAQDEWKLLVVFGGGVKYRLHRNVVVRGELLDYVTGFPRRQIAPAGSNTTRGIFQQVTPLFGISYSFR